jgi:uncharacterized protein (TIGR02646 family)
MLKLKSENLTQPTITHLASKQKRIDDLADFEEKVREANRLWDNKGGSAFTEIRDKLEDMCISIGVCVYCEGNKANNIEHIYPKKLYPEKAFVWNNYVLVCGICNSTHKVDKFKIFNPEGSQNVEDVTVPSKIFRPPENDDALFLNQRNEDDNPMNFIELDLTKGTYLFSETHKEKTRGYERAKYTIELLSLNDRGDLVESRQSADTFFSDRLETYVKVKKSNNFEELMIAVKVNHDENIFPSHNFEEEKQRILNSTTKQIQKRKHQTVWKELVRQRARLPRINTLLNDAPEALNW